MQHYVAAAEKTAPILEQGRRSWFLVLYNFITTGSIQNKNFACHRSEDSISTKSSHHTNVMLRKHSEGRHSERSRQEHSSNRKRSVRLIFNYLEMYSTYLAFWYNYVHFRQIGQLPVRANCAPKMYILPKNIRQMTTIIES